MSGDAERAGTQALVVDVALVVDWTACDGRGMCVELLPELLDADPWGYPKPRGSQRVPPGTLGTVPSALAPAARQAVNLCPLLALRLNPVHPVR